MNQIHWVLSFTPVDPDWVVSSLECKECISHGNKYCGQIIFRWPSLRNYENEQEKINKKNGQGGMENNEQLKQFPVVYRKKK